MIYDFDERLAFSQGNHVISDIEFLKKTIPQCIEVIKTDIETDKQGIDYIAKLKGGAEIGIDVKMREKGASKFWDYGEAELALEIWSVCPNNTITGIRGWTLSDKTNVDFILYMFDSSDWNKSYLLPYQLLRMAFLRNGRNWVQKYPRKRQTSNNWQSEAIFVPVSVVIDAIKAEMQVITKECDKS